MTVAVEFASADEAVAALPVLKSLGYLNLETYAPFPLTDPGAHAPRGSLPVAIMAAAGGLAALAAAYVVQWWANVASYPLNIGGRPAHAAPAFVPATFETICLLATLGAFVGFLLAERLPRLWQPLFEIEGFERAVVDRFWIVIDGTTPVDRITADVMPLHPLRIVVGDEPS